VNLPPQKEKKLKTMKREVSVAKNGVDVVEGSSIVKLTLP
jgi:hypothetical protein